MAGLDGAGFATLGVPVPPDTTALERHAAALEAAAGAQGALGDHGLRAYRLGEGNAGAADDALGEFMTGQAGVLPRNTAYAKHVSLAASVSRIALTTVKWAGGVLGGLAGLAGLALLTPQGRALLLPRLRPFAQRVQGWIRTAMQAVGRLFTRLAELVRGKTAKERIGNDLAAEARLISNRGRQTLVARAATRARISAGRAADSMRRADERLTHIEGYLNNARKTVQGQVDAAYARGEMNAAERAWHLRPGSGWADHGMLDEETRWHLSQQGPRLEQIETQLSRHSAAHLDDARRQVTEGLGVARTYQMDTAELDALHGEVSGMINRRSDLAERAYLARLDLHGPFRIQDMYRI